MSELFHGSPTFRPLSQREWIDWLAVMTVVEPHEAEERAQAIKEAGRR